MGALGSKFGNRAKQVGQNASNAASDAWGQAKNAVSNAYGQAKDAVSNAYGQAKQNVQNAYGNAKRTYQAGSANQDAQKAIKNAVDALNALKAADQKLQQNGMNSVIGNKQQAEAIDNCIKALSGGGFTSIGSRFQTNRDYYAR